VLSFVFFGLEYVELLLVASCFVDKGSIGSVQEWDEIG
jgi:hypothetical protein